MLEFDIEVVFKTLGSVIVGTLLWLVRKVLRRIRLIYLRYEVMHYVLCNVLGTPYEQAYSKALEQRKLEQDLSVED